MRAIHSTDELSSFREEARTWIEENKPRTSRPEDDAAAREFDCAWQHQQFTGGWAGVGWPAEHGGRGLSPQEQMVWYEELVEADAPGMGAFTVALGHAGPTIIGRGTDEQKRNYLPRILRGETPWCQGFSEPGSGSDLASLRTRATVDGDELVINGSKIWTSFAHVADFQELLVRTDPEASRHRGLSWVIVPMDSAGLTVRRIRTIDGEAGFCECFYDDVRVPLANVVGGLHDGWSVAMYTLAIERGLGFLSTRLEVIRSVERLIEEARRRDRLTDTRIAAELAAVRAQAAAIRALGYDGISATARPELVGAVNRVFYGELRQRVARLAVDLLGPDGLQSNPWSTAYLESLSFTIASGTKEIQKNILGERVLGLPR